MNPLQRIYDKLFAAYGPQRWWPGETKTEIIVGAILTQNTAWINVERAIANLANARVLDWASLYALSEEDLAQLIRSAGTYRVKARRLMAFVDVLFERHDGSIEAMLAPPASAARSRLLAIHGIGPETADAILLYAGGHATFVVDAYTTRILRRHLLIDDRTTYADVQSLFHQQLPADAQLFNEYHALLVRVGKNHCRTRAACEGCPLADLPHDERR